MGSPTAFRSCGGGRSGERAGAEQAHVPEEVARAGGDLVEEGSDALAEGKPISGEAVLLEHVAREPAPTLLDGIEPRGVRRQPDRLAPWEPPPRREDVGMRRD